MNRGPSLKTLIREFPSVDPENLKLLRKAWGTGNRAQVKEMAERYTPGTYTWLIDCHSPPSTRHVRRRIVDELLETHGVEYLGKHRRTGEDVYYCNAGDTYAATLIFHGSNMYIGCWGDLVERGQVRED